MYFFGEDTNSELLHRVGKSQVVDENRAALVHRLGQWICLLSDTRKWQSSFVGMVQLQGVELTREALVKIERGIQHVKASQFKAIKEALQTSFDELLKE